MYLGRCLRRTPVFCDSLLTAQSRTLHASAKRPSSSLSAKDIADDFLNKFVNQKPVTVAQLLDANQLHLFLLTLQRNIPSAPSRGTPVAPGYHLAYFTPTQKTAELGQDGSNTDYNPTAPFTRRMWAGGSVHFPGAEKNVFLRVGDIVTETTKLLSCEHKIIKKTNTDMLVVGVEKEYRTPNGELAVIDKRNWIFREALDTSNPPKPSLKPEKKSEKELEGLFSLSTAKALQKYNREPVTLFRFSALTFNGHRIHYDKPWAVDVEGHRNIVVHGPLNLLAMLDLWRDHQQGSSGQDIRTPKDIEYRATSPVYAGEPYTIAMHEHEGGAKIAEVKVISDDGSLCMKGKISDF